MEGSVVGGCWRDRGREGCRLGKTGCETHLKILVKSRRCLDYALDLWFDWRLGFHRGAACHSVPARRARPARRSRLLGLPLPSLALMTTTSDAQATRRGGAGARRWREWKGVNGAGQDGRTNRADTRNGVLIDVPAPAPDVHTFLSAKNWRKRRKRKKKIGVHEQNGLAKALRCRSLIHHQALKGTLGGVKLRHVPP